MLNGDKQLFELRRQLDRGTQDHDERPVQFPEKDRMADGLDDLGRPEKPMKVLQHEDRRGIVTSRRCRSPHGSQRIARFGGDRDVTDGLQAAFDVPGGELPPFVTRHRREFRDGVLMFL